MGSIQSWRIGGYVEALADGHQLVLVDLRGHGLSEKPTTPPAYAVAQQIEDVVAVLDDAGLESAILVGSSLGGDVALGAAAFRPERIDGVVTIGATGAAVGFADVTKPNAKEVRKIATRLAKEGTAAVVGEEDAESRPEWTRHLRRADPKAMAALWRAQAVVKRGDKRLAELPRPLLAIRGELDAAPLPLAAPEAAATVVLPGEDRTSAFLRSDLVVPEIRRFVSAIPIRRTDW
jgi:3-oxoadipate enol-lactonase